MSNGEWLLSVCVWSIVVIWVFITLSHYLTEDFKGIAAEYGPKNIRLFQITTQMMFAGFPCHILSQLLFNVPVTEIRSLFMAMGWLLLAPVLILPCGDVILKQRWGFAYIAYARVMKTNAHVMLVMNFVGITIFYMTLESWWY